MWPDRRLLELFHVEHPILQAPMAGPCYADMAVAVAEAGGLGSLPTATFTPDQMREQLQIIRQQTQSPSTSISSATASRSPMRRAS